MIAGLQSALHEDVPSGTTVLIAIGAPIRVPKQTMAKVEERVRRWLGDAPECAELHEMVNGNQIHVRLVSAATSPNIFVFIHNPEFDTDALFDANLHESRS